MNPDYETAETATNTIGELTADLIKGNVTIITQEI